jgi:hypothetical protein
MIGRRQETRSVQYVSHSDRMVEREREEPAPTTNVCPAQKIGQPEGANCTDALGLILGSRSATAIRGAAQRSRQLSG